MVVQFTSDLAAAMAAAENSPLLQWVRLLGDMTEKGILKRDPEDKNSLLVYRTAGTQNPEGWYSQNIFEAARELLNDEKSQYSMLNALGNAGWMPVYSPEGKYQEIIRRPPDPPAPPAP